MTVIKECACRLRSVFIGERPFRFDRLLGYARYTVHGICERNPMPVNRCPIGEGIREVHLEYLAFRNTQLGPRELRII